MTITANAQAALRRDFIERGFYRKATRRILLELGVNVTLAIAGAMVVFESHVLWIRICGLLLSTLGSIGVGTNTHTSSHYATSNKRWVNELLTYFGYSFFLGMSTTFWWHKHIVVHHPAPNVVGMDDDMDLAPWFARTRDEVERAKGLLRFYYEHVQWLVLPVALAANDFSIQKSGWVFLIGRLWRRETRKKAHWIDLVCLLMHYALNLVIPMFFFSAESVILFYVMRVVLLGYAMFAVLAPGHMPVEAACLTSGDKNTDAMLLQTATTVNFRTGPIGRLVCSGLEYQIEHHLFPNVSHVYYPAMSVLVRAFCLENGLPYRSYGWHHVLWKCLCSFRTPPRIEHRLESLRIQPKSSRL